MSLQNDKTLELWRGFIPQKKEIKNTISNHLFSVRVYHTALNDPKDFNQEITKWATLEVSSFDSIPKNMNSLNLRERLYAVFDYKGLNTDTRIFNYIYGEWIQNSKYSLDNRPHFEILGEKYKNNDPNSEEEIWIPIKLKAS